MTTLYSAFDFIGLYEPDPPWVCVPKENDQFLRATYIPMRDSGKCPYCTKRVRTVTLGIRAWQERMREFVKAMNASPDECEATLSRCTSCGWWCVFQMTTGSLVIEEKNYSSLIDLIAVNWAKIKEFDVSHAEISLKRVKDYLSSESVWPILTSAEKLMGLISGCFNEQFPCEVIHIESTKKDSGEIFLVNSDFPVLVRIDQDTRKVEFVREILGFDIKNDHYHAMWISTENRFVDEDVLMPEMKGAGFPISLKNYDAVLSILKVISDTPVEPWENIWQMKS
jgi:hypothetical protein